MWWEARNGLCRVRNVQSRRQQILWKVRAPPSSTLATPILDRLEVLLAQSYIPHHLAERILSSRGALEGERKQVTVLFADLKGSMELLADRDPEEARALLDIASRIRGRNLQSSSQPHSHRPECNCTRLLSDTRKSYQPCLY